MLGGLLGSVILFSTEGLDFALTALFVVLFLGQLENAGSRIYGLIGGLFAGGAAPGRSG